VSGNIVETSKKQILRVVMNQDEIMEEVREEPEARKY